MHKFFKKDFKVCRKKTYEKLFRFFRSVPLIDPQKILCLIRILSTVEFCRQVPLLRAPTKICELTTYCKKVTQPFCLLSIFAHMQTKRTLRFGHISSYVSMLLFNRGTERSRGNGTPGASGLIPVQKTPSPLTVSFCGLYLINLHFTDPSLSFFCNYSKFSNSKKPFQTARRERWRHIALHRVPSHLGQRNSTEQRMLLISLLPTKPRARNRWPVRTMPF